VAAAKANEDAVQQEKGLFLGLWSAMDEFIPKLLFCIGK
jgi:hypothetical protein